MDIDVSIKQKLSSRLDTRRIVSALSIIVGGTLFLAAAAVAPAIIKQQNLPPLKSLKAGTYVPAQVVFKVKPGKSAASAIKRLVGKKQTMYKKNGADTYVPLAEAEKVTNDTTYQKTSIALHQKSVQQLFPEPKLTDAVREKILRRPGASDPNESYKRLELDRWYVATIEEAYADVAQMIRQLEVDTENIDHASPNMLRKLFAVQSDVAQEVISPPGSTSTTCDNPNDSYSCSYGHLSSSSVADQWYLNVVKAREAWLYTHGTPQTIIAVIDSGVDFRHTELKKNIWLNSPEDINHNGCAEYWPPMDFSGHVSCSGEMTYSGGDMNGIDEDGNGYIDDVNGIDLEGDMTVNDDTQGPDDTVGHGTGVASIIAAETNTANGEGIAGICWTCTLMPIALPDSEDENVIAGLSYAANNGADVVNMSLGGPDIYGEGSALLSALDYVKSLGVTLVAATGNADQDIGVPNAPILPANGASVISVGAVDQSANRWHDDRSPEGVGSGSNWGNNLSILAPGVEILKALAHRVDTRVSWAFSDYVCPGLNCIIPSTGPYAGFPNRNYYYSTGTSFSAPIVSGIIGLMKSTNPSLGPDEIKRILESTATDMTDVVDENGNEMTGLVGWDKYSGYGLVNAQAAVKQAYDLRPDFALTVTPGTTPITAAGPNSIRFDVWVENRGWATADHVPYKVVNTDTNTTVYSGFTRTLYGNVGGWLNETVSVAAVPSRAKIILDPDNLYSESFENDNSSPILTIPVYGTPYINHQERKEVSVGGTVTFQVGASDVNTPIDQLTYTASNLPSGATFSNKTFTWVPTAAQASGLYQPVFSVADPTGLQSAATIPIQLNNQSAVAMASITASTASFEMAEISWITTASADSKVNFGTTTSYGQESFNPTTTTTHSHSFRVIPGTVYHFQVTSCTAGASRSCVTSADQVYQAPLIPTATLSNLQVRVQNDRWPYLITTAWDTDIPTSGQVNWGIGNTDTRTNDDVAWGTHHETTIVVQPNTIYQVSVSGCTNQVGYYQRCLESQKSTIQVPVIASPPTPLVTIANNAATISWTCSATPTSGTVQLYKSGSLVASKDYAYGNQHSVTFPVTPSTQYTYHVRGTNANYWCSDMDNLQFTAPAYNTPPVLPVIPSQIAYRGTVFSYVLPVASDPEGKAITYSASSLPPGATFDPATRKLLWTLATDRTYLASYTVQYKATDADGASATATVKITIQTLSSFLPGTQVTLEGGGTRAIDQLQVGDIVKTYNSDMKKWGSGTIEHIYIHTASAYYRINGVLQVTEKHPLLTQRGWTMVGELAYGDRLVSEHGFVAVQSKVRIEQEVTVYNLEVSGNHTYLAGGVVAHNKQNPYISN